MGHFLNMISAAKSILSATVFSFFLVNTDKEQQKPVLKWLHSSCSAITSYIQNTVENTAGCISKHQRK